MQVGIIGAGAMGSGIAQVAATAGCEVLLYDTNETALVKARERIHAFLNKSVEKGKKTDLEVKEIIGRILYIDQLESVANAQLIIEAIIEDLAIKASVFKTLEGIVSEECIIATNTSSLAVTELAAALKNPSRCIGIHFFNPAPLMKLVEIIPAFQTNKKIIDKSLDIINSWGKLTVVAKDTPGFIVNRIARPFYSEAIRMYEEGIADPMTIDWVMKNYAGFRMGPFALMDYIGHDVNYKVTETVWKAFYFDPRYKPSFTQLRLSQAGYLGRKSGQGFYEYDEKGAPKTNDIPIIPEEKCKEISDRIISMLINEAADALHLNIASTADIEKAMTKGVNYPKGLLAWADEMGISNVVKNLDDLYHLYHEDRYRTSPLLRRMSINNQSFHDGSSE